MNQFYCKECEICFDDETLKNCRNCNNDNLIQIDPNFLLCPVCGCKDMYIKKKLVFNAKGIWQIINIDKQKI